VLLSYFNGKTEVRVFDRQGEYLRTILPYPASTPPERTAPIGEIRVEGQRLPIVFSSHSQSLQPLTATLREQQMAFSPKGHLLLVSGVGHWAENGPPQHLLALHPEGGAPEDTGFVGPRIRRPVGYLGGGAGDTKAWAFSAVAASPDGQWIYLTNMISGRATPGPTREQFKNQHAVYRLRWTDQKLGEPFLGAGEPGEDDGHFNWPRGLATDPDGNLYVCDHGNNRVMVFSPDGKLLGKIPVKDPHQITVHPKTRELYVLSTNDLTAAWDSRYGRVAKFSPLCEGKSEELAAFSSSPHLPGGAPGKFRPAEPFPWAMALDESANPPKLWVAMLEQRTYGWGHTRVKLIPVLDHGESLRPGHDVTDDRGLPMVMFLAVDPVRNRLLVRGRTYGYRALDQASGETSVLPETVADAYEIAVDRKGNCYRYGPWGSNVVLRYDPEGRPLPFESTGTNRLVVPLYARGTISGRGLCVGPDGTVYAIANGLLRKQGCGQGVTRVMAFAPDGALTNGNLVPSLGLGDCSVGVDASGNIYLGINVKPADKPYPLEFAKLLPGAEGQGPSTWWWWPDARNGADKAGGRRPVPWCYPYQNPYLFHWGAVLKFGPDGGTIEREKRTPMSCAGDYRLNVDRAGELVAAADAAARQGDWQEARAGYEEAAILDPENQAARAGLRSARRHAGEALLPLSHDDSAEAVQVYRSGYLDSNTTITGAEWRYAGFGPCPASGQPWGDPGCVCYNGRFAVDPYGRVFLPNPFRFCVEITDTGGNRLLRFGAYGNADSAGPDSREPEPAIAFGFPYAVAGCEGRVYVSDILNERIAAIRLSYAAEASCAIE